MGADDGGFYGSALPDKTLQKKTTHKHKGASAMIVARTRLVGIPCDQIPWVLLCVGEAQVCQKGPFLTVIYRYLATYTLAPLRYAKKSSISHMQ